MKRIRFCRVMIFGFLLLTLILNSCGGGGGNSPPSSTTNLIGTTGGSATSADGKATVQVPAGALATSTTITIASSIANVPQGNIGNVFDFGPEGITFNTPVTISMKYDPNVIPQGVAESSLTLAFLSGSTWTDIPTTIDTINKLLIGQTTHFSTYGAKTPDANKLQYGTLIDSTPTGVNIYSNGCIDPSLSTPKCIAINHQTYPDTPNTNNAAGYNSGLKWQCVEFINRYYYQTYSKDIKVGGGDAKDYFSDTFAQTKGLVKYSNGGSVPPQIGDIIVSVGNGAPGNVGHVAIVWKVDSNGIHLAQQNWDEGRFDSDFFLPINPGNTVANFSSSYPVTGWLRLPVNLNGVWSGTYILTTPSGSESSVISLSLAQSGTTVTGSWQATNGAVGTLSGTVNGNTVSATFHQTNPTCTGNFQTNSNINGNTMTITSGSGSTTCTGPYTGISGSVVKN